MMDGQNSGLKIIKARVEQDKYAAVELRIIKADGINIQKDLYVERDFNDGDLFVVSDNVLVTLHRALRAGESANLQLITNKGEILMPPEFSEIKQMDNNLFVGVKAVSNMISVKNNQSLKTDALKVQEIAVDSRSIKDQMINTAKDVNPVSVDDLKFIYEDAYNEAAIYKIEKVNDHYEVKNIGDKCSFIATDGVNVYTHSNIVTDTTKLEQIGEEKVLVQNIEKSGMPVFTFGKIDDSVSMFDKFAPKKMDNPVISEEKSDSNEYVSELSEVNVDNVILPDPEENSTNVEEVENKDEKTDFFADSENVVESKEESVEEENNNQVFDDFFGISSSDNTEVSSMIDDSYDGENDKFEQLSSMISKLVNDRKASQEKITNYEEKVEELNQKLDKVNMELESKTKKVNILINQNRQFGDENRMLKNRVNGLQDKTERLEATNKEYLEENEKLKAKASKENAKLNGIISSVSELLGSYGDVDSSYTVKRKVA